MSKQRKNKPEKEIRSYDEFLSTYYPSTKPEIAHDASEWGALLAAELINSIKKANKPRSRA